MAGDGDSLPDDSGTSTCVTPPTPATVELESPAGSRNVFAVKLFAPGSVAAFSRLVDCSCCKYGFEFTERDDSGLAEVNAARGLGNELANGILAISGLASGLTHELPPASGLIRGLAKELLAANGLAGKLPTAAGLANKLLAATGLVSKLPVAVGLAGKLTAAAGLVSKLLAAAGLANELSADNESA